MSRLSKLKDVLEAIAALAVIGGVPLFFLQQCSERQSVRVQSSLQFVSIYNGDAYIALRNKLEAPWANLDSSAIIAEHPSQAVLTKLKLDIWRNSNVTTADLARMVDFYTSVLSCRDRKVCDEKTIEMQFHGEIVGFYCNYQPALAEVAKGLNRPRFVEPLKIYAGDCKFGD